MHLSSGQSAAACGGGGGGGVAGSRKRKILEFGGGSGKVTLPRPPIRSPDRDDDQGQLHTPQGQTPQGCGLRCRQVAQMVLPFYNH